MFHFQKVGDMVLAYLNDDVADADTIEDMEIDTSDAESNYEAACTDEPGTDDNSTRSIKSESDLAVLAVQPKVYCGYNYKAKLIQTEA